MRVVVLHESPLADRLCADFQAAVKEFNRGLDVRLRFLDVGFELRCLPVPEDAPPAAALLDTLSRFQPGVVLLLGRGAALLECGAVAAKARPALAYVAESACDPTAAALARLASILVTTDPAIDTPRAPDAVLAAPSADRPLGAQLVEILVRTVREKRPR